MISKSIIVALNKKMVIGNNNQMLWYDKEDLKRFKELTSGRPIIMGRKTHESIGRILPNRPNIIVTKNPNYIPQGLPAYVVPNLEAAFSIAEGECQQLDAEQMFVIGGGEIYRQAIPYCDTLYVSEFFNELDGNVKFCDINLNEWEEVFLDKTETHIFKVLNRIKGK